MCAVLLLKLREALLTLLPRAPLLLGAEKCCAGADDRPVSPCEKRCPPWNCGDRPMFERAPLLAVAAPRSPWVPAERFANVEPLAAPNRFQFPVPAPRAELKFDLVIALRDATDAAPYRDASWWFG